MSSGNYETQILETIQMLVDNAVSKANFDKTIQGTISRCVDATIGKYIVKYQNSSFYAYSYNTDTAYPAGTSVYVLVPENDMSKEKSIIGTVDKLGPDYVSIIEGESGYEVTGVNTINSDATFGLCSYKDKDVKVLYDKENDINLIDLDTFGFENYIKKSNSIICGATFKTSLPAEQQFRGDYGIVFNLDFMDNATGETVTKTYMVNVDQMTGNPYSYTSNSRQYGIFEVDGANFIAVNQIYIFEYDFPNREENKENDIFISKFELSAANALEATEAATCALTFITPQGTYFDDNDLDSDIRTLQAQIRIKGNAIDNDSQLVKYYWFVENNNISTKSEKYNQYGGAGWECLNERNIIQPATADSEAIVQWVSGTYQYQTKKIDNIAKETNYKCVAVYSNDTILSRTITIYNYSSAFEISIKSDGGTAFFYDIGHPTLTCYVNGEEAIEAAYEYVWSEINNHNQFSVLEETAEANIDYNAAVNSKNILMEQIEAEQVLTGQVQEELDVINRVLAQYENVMRVEGNKIHNLKISAITSFSTYKCSVYKNGVFIGTSSIIITNSLQNDNAYTLVINNGNQIFKYNEMGISPASPSLENPVTVLPLSFTLYDHKGEQINVNAIGRKNIFWTVPNRNSLINISTVHGAPISSTSTTDTYTEYEELNFDIDTKYDSSRENNEIQLTINYKDKVLTAKTNFTFTKEGEIGTNGTEFVCKIVPFVRDGEIAPLYPTVTYNNYNQTYSLNYTTSEDKWFKVQLWHDGELIFNNTESGLTEEKEQATVKWSILKNNYGNNIEDSSNLAIAADTGKITFNPEFGGDMANIVKCTIAYKGVEYYATMPVIVAEVENSDYTINLADRTGFRSVLYTADGQSPSYDSANPFEVIVTQNINGVKENISQLELSEFAVTYNWDVMGSVYFKEWKPCSNLIEKTLYASREKRNQKYYEPVETFDGLCVTNAVWCRITREENVIGSIYIPIHFYLNRHGNAAMNGWDGNSISIDDNNSGVILAPQVGAGKKNEDNTFTGVFMGTIKEAGAEEVETGLFGYNSGERTIALNAEDGSAEFGRRGAGQIRIDPSTNEALLTSGNYDEEAGTGMIINLSEPSIKFGSGNFKVDKNGNVIAKGFATGGDLEDAKESLKQDIEKVEESIKAFDISLDFVSFNFPCNTEHYPINDSTFIVNYVGTYKNKTINKDNLSITLQGAAAEGIIVNTSTKGVITFSVSADTQVPNEQNTFTFEFSYTDSEGNLYTDVKSVYIGLSLQGKDGAQGEQGPAGNDGEAGKSAYQIAVEEGFKGTEEEWLKSLIGKDGVNGQPGAPGKNGQTSYLHIAYANSEDGITDFSTTDSLNKLYIGQYTDFIEADSEEPSKYHWTLIKGEQGPQGDKGETGDKGDIGETGVGIKEIIEQYNLSNSNTTYYEDNWVETQPEWQENHYFWTRSKVIYTDNTIKYTPAVLAQALNNANNVANTANTNANNAVNTANTASSTADQAKQDAAAANQTANSASSKADTAIANSNSTSQALNTLKEEVQEQYDNLQGQIDGAIETWFENYEPTLENKPAVDWTIEEKENHVGDLFYIIDNEEKGGQCYRFAKVGNEYQWIIVEDVGVAKAIADAAKAQQSADGAQSSADIAKGIADGKATVFFGTKAPEADKPQLGDLWMNSESGEILTYTDKGWEKLNTYTDDTVANEAKDLANDANSTANTAKDTADAAKSTADNANQTATNAHNEVQNTVRQVDVEYYIATSEDEIPTQDSDKWNTKAPQWTPGTFIWSRQKMYFVDETKAPQYSNPARITGAKGETGETGSAGKGIKETVIEYVVTNGNEEIPTTGWDRTFPTNTPTGKYIWTKTTIKYTEGEPSISYSVSRVGEDGSPGNPGEPGTSVTITDKHIHYVVSASGTEIPSDSANWVEAENNQLPTTKEDEFLWSRTWIIYSDGTEAKTYSVSRNPKNGEKGDKGDDGASAKLVSIAASSTIFKSNTGKNGTFYPNNITLTPDFQGVTGETVSWQYALDGATWENAVNGQHGITLNTNTKELTISKDTDLFTDDNSIITFKCIAEDNATYNTISISKIYDIVDMNIGARNYALKTATDLFIVGTGEALEYSGTYSLVEYFKNLVGETVTVSAYYKLDENTAPTTGTIYLEASNAQEQWKSLNDLAINISNFNNTNFIKKTFTFKIPQSFTDTDYNQIGFRISNFTGTLIVQKFKIELGNVATDWTMALEDLNEETVIQYAITDTQSEVIGEDDWYTYLAEFPTDKYIWQRTAVKKDGETISTSEISCIYAPQKSIISTVESYYVWESNDALPLDSITEEDWMNKKPSWDSSMLNKYLWVRVLYKYSDGSEAYAAPYCDETWSELSSLSQSFLDYTTELDNRLATGVVQIKDDTIRIYDSANEDEATKCIIINSDGIGYLQKEEGKTWAESKTVKSVWGIDGTFDAQLLNVINLTADEIKDGVLKLGGSVDLTPLGTFNTYEDMINALTINGKLRGSIGDAYKVGTQDPYDWYVWDNDTETYKLREGGYFILTDSQNLEIAKISVDGLEIIADDSSQVNIFAENDNPDGLYGLCLRGPGENGTGPIIAYTNTSANTWNVKNEVVEESLTIGASIQIVPIMNGIGFVSIYNN